MNAQESLGAPVSSHIPPPTHLPGTPYPVALGPGQPAQRGVAPTHDMLIALMRWTSQIGELPLTDNPPNIEMTSTARITAVQVQALAGWQMPASAGATMNESDAVSVYHTPSRTIYLQADWNANSAADVSVLVHELVHHLQTVAGQTFECPQACERTAYQTQSRWLELFDSDLSREFDVDPFTIFVRSACLS